jgi:hypothetical protein
MDSTTTTWLAALIFVLAVFCFGLYLAHKDKRH